jgi:hypothetical protein
MVWCVGTCGKGLVEQQWGSQDTHKTKEDKNLARNQKSQKKVKAKDGQTNSVQTLSVEWCCFFFLV